MKEYVKTPLILERPLLSTLNAHIDVGIGEIRFTIKGKEERFAFKPRLEQASLLESQEEQGSKILPPNQDNPGEAIQLENIKIPALQSKVIIRTKNFHFYFIYILFTLKNFILCP